MKNINTLYAALLFLHVSLGYSQNSGFVSGSLEIVESGVFELLDGTKIEIEEEEDLFIVNVGESTSFCLGSDVVVSRSVLSEDQSTLVLELWRTRSLVENMSGGLWYDSLLVISSSVEEDRPNASIYHVLDESRLRRVKNNGSFVQSVMSADDFPVLELRIGIDLPDGRVVYELQRWNVINQKRVWP